MASSISSTSSGLTGRPMSKPTPDSDIIHPSAERASSMASPLWRARDAATLDASVAASRSPSARHISLDSSASSTRSRMSTFSVSRPSTRSIHAAASS